MLRFFAGVVSLMTLAAPLVVRAQDTPAETTAPEASHDAAAAEARVHFEEGLEHFSGRAFREAIQSFHRAAALVPSADLWFNIARAHEELDEHEQAIEYYRRYLRDRVDPPDRARVEARITQLEQMAEEARRARRHRASTGTLRLRVSQVGAEVRVDDVVLGTSPLLVPLSLPPGPHRLQVSMEGYIPYRAEVQIRAGVTSAAYVDLEAAVRYRAVRGRRRVTWVTTALGGAALVGGGVFGVLSRRDQQDGDLPAARDHARRADYLFGATGGLAVVTVVVSFVEARAVGTERIDPPDADPAPEDDLDVE